MLRIEWFNSMVSFLRERARHMREPVHWEPEPAQKPSLPSDRNGNRTVRPGLKITKLQATDDEGREWTILEIIPVEPIQGYERLHFVDGHPRYELRDGTPVVQHSDTAFEVAGNRLTIAR